MNRIFAILGLVVLATAIGYCQETFRVEDARSSFEIPESWELVSEKTGLKNETMIQHYFIDHSLPVLIKSSYGDNYNIYFSNEVSQKKREEKIEGRWIAKTKEPQKKEVIESSVEFILEKLKEQPENWADAELINAECEYDLDKHAYFQTIELYKADVGSLVQFQAVFLGRFRETVFKFLWQGEYPDDFLDYAYSVVESFSYDDDYGFGEGRPEVIEEPAPRSPYIWLLPAIGIVLLIFLAKKWAAS